MLSVLLEVSYSLEGSFTDWNYSLSFINWVLLFKRLYSKAISKPLDLFVSRGMTSLAFESNLKKTFLHHHVMLVEILRLSDSHNFCQAVYLEEFFTL